MVITKIQGGLGNQLFQWAYGRSIELETNLVNYLDTNFYNYDNHRKFELNQFLNIKYNTVIPKLDKVTIYKIDDDFNYKKHILLKDSCYYLDGYWQSEKYFKEYRNIILKELEPSDVLLSKLSKTPLIDTNTTSIHIRRTDYITSNGVHPVKSIKYYQDALDIIGDYDYLFIFSDDIQWCKDNLKFNNMIFMDGLTNIEDLYLMSMCKNNIIANSSFSWWAAWLNKNIDKKVIAPLNWFGSQTNINDSDIIPESWIKI
jgi:hypothetical protein